MRRLQTSWVTYITNCEFESQITITHIHKGNEKCKNDCKHVYSSCELYVFVVVPWSGAQINNIRSPINGSQKT